MGIAAGKHLVVMNKEPLDFKLDMNKDIEFNCAMGDVQGTLIRIYK